MVKVQLKRDLRRHVLRGHPWVYRDSLESPIPEPGQMCQVLDNKGDSLAWGYISSSSSLALRILSTQNKPPGVREFLARAERAWELRRRILPGQTNGYRWINGEGDGLPGLVIDVYGSIGVVQFDGHGPATFWHGVNMWDQLMAISQLRTLFFKKRRRSEGYEEDALTLIGEDIDLVAVPILENGVAWQVNVLEGQKTGFFFDQRENRAYVSQLSRGLSCLNMYSYTGGFSVACGVGGAKDVTSVDLAGPAIELAQINWELNGLPPEGHHGIRSEAQEFLQMTRQKWDLIIVDPPSMAPSERTKAAAMTTYQDIFSAALKRLQSGGHICFSSCSSHISFEDFFAVINESLSKARLRGQILRVSGQGGDHPFPHACHELRYLKFVHLQLTSD